MENQECNFNLDKFENLEDAEKQQFKRYMELLLEWNEKINLTAITDENEIKVKHFLDSLTIAKYIKNGSRVIDIGTGAGFPGIPLKIHNESLKITLLDSLNKRVNFLNEVIENLGLKDIEAIHGRAEEVARNKAYREKFDYATSRAVSKLPVLLEYMIPFLKVGGEAICMKGPAIDDEIKDSENALKRLGARIEKIEELNLAGSDMQRRIIIIKKIKSTDKIFPRKAGMPLKNPL